MNIALVLLPGLAVAWAFAWSNWLNSPRCLVNIWHLARGFADRASYGSYWEPYSLCVDPYWVNQWIKNYAAGFAKRGLIGHLLTSVGGGRVDLIAVNIASFLFCIFLVYLIAAKLCLLIGFKSWPLVFAWVSLLWMTPFGKSFVETAGDPLQLIVVLWLLLSLLFWLCRDFLNSRNWIVDLLVSLLYVASILIYEGAFLLAAIPFFFLARRTWVWCVGVGSAVVLIARLSGSESFELEHKIAEALVAYNPLNHLEMSYRSGGAIASQVSFMDNFWMECAKYLAFPSQAFSDCVTVAALAFVLAAALRAFCMGCFARFGDSSERKALVRILSSFMLSIVVSLPFFFVTHDWTRYVCVLFALAIAVPSRKHFFVESSSFGVWLRQLRGTRFLAGLGQRLPLVALSDRIALCYSFAVILALAVFMPHAIDLRTNLPPPYRYFCWFLAVFMMLFFPVSVAARRLSKGEQVP